jgi:5'-methylthioadenosine phosphorylase
MRLIQRELPLGTFILVDQVADRAPKRESSSFGKGCVEHASMVHPVSPRLRIHLAAAAMVEGLNAVRDGAYFCIERPQFIETGLRLPWQGRKPLWITDHP